MAEKNATKGIAVIDGVEYTLNSDNRPLLKKLDGWKKKDDSGKWIDVQYDYLPISVVLQLMDGLFLAYDIRSQPVKYTGEEYTVEKKVYSNWSWVDGKDLVRAYEKTVIVEVTMPDGTVRIVEWYAQSVASVKQLTSDPSRNWFMQKLSARARKEALKNLGRVFRVLDEEFDDDQLIVEDVENATKGTGVSQSSKPTPVVDDIAAAADDETIYNKIKERMAREYELFFDDEWVFAKQTLISVIASIKKELDAKSGSPELKALERLYKEILPRATE